MSGLICLPNESTGPLLAANEQVLLQVGYFIAIQPGTAAKLKLVCPNQSTAMQTAEV